jgi:hypothetical protein
MNSPLRVMGAGLLLGAIAVSSGCGAGQTPRAADPDQAHQALRTVLDAWKSGEMPADLGKRTPPIRVLDLDWQAGHALLGYQAGAEGKRVGHDMNYPVQLELRNSRGRTIKKTAVYTVTTHPEVLVLRQEG